MSDNKRESFPDLTIRSSAYGQTIPIVHGRARVMANIIWGLDNVEVKDEAASSDNAEYSYFATFAASFNDGPVDAVEKIWLDNKLIYDSMIAEVGDILTNGSMEAWTGSTIDDWTTAGTVAQESTIVDPEAEGSEYSVKLSTGASDAQASISQSVTYPTVGQYTFRIRAYCSQPANQWARLTVTLGSTVYTPWFQVPTNRWTTITGNYTPASTPLTEAFKITVRDQGNADVYIDSVSLTQTSANVLDGDASNFRMEIFNGNYDQPRSDIISDNHPWGVDFVPAYRGQAYVVFENLPLESFDNRIPNVEAQIQSVARGVSDIVEDACIRCGINEDEFSVSSMSDTYGGMITNSEATGASLLSTVQEPSPFAVRESEGMIQFQSLAGQSSVKTFTEAELNARGDKDAPDTAVRISISDVSMLPQEVVVTCLDPDNNQNETTQRARTHQFDIGSIQTYNWPIIADADQTRQFADMLLARALLTREATIDYASNNVHLQTGDIITVPRAGEDIQFKIDNIEMNSLGRFSVTCSEYCADAYESDSIGASSDGASTPPATA